MDKYKDIKDQLTKYLNSLIELRRLGVTPNSKDFTSQLGEWLVAEIYNGVKAESGIQKDWDIQVGKDFIQVKTHAKSESTNARWSAIKYDIEANINFVIIVVFSSEYKLKEFYKIPWVKCIDLIKRNKDKDVLMWNSLIDYKVQLEDLPNREIINFFI
jgi:hypothetical protein